MPSPCLTALPPGSLIERLEAQSTLTPTELILLDCLRAAIHEIETLTLELQHAAADDHGLDP